MIVELARAQIGFEDRRLGLLRLQYQRILPVAADKEKYRGAGADAANSHDLASHVHETVGPKQVPPVLVQALGILAAKFLRPLLLILRVSVLENVAQRDQQRRDAAETYLAVNPLGQLRQRA